MFIVSWTINRGEEDLQDYFILCDSIEEARTEADRLREIDRGDGAKDAPSRPALWPY